jgi:hypothetical protein
MLFAGLVTPLLGDFIEAGRAMAASHFWHWQTICADLHLVGSKSERNSPIHIVQKNLRFRLE